MQGFQLSFYTRADVRHEHQPLSEWLLLEARRLGIGGGTLFGASEGFGRGGRIHSAGFVELADQPVEVTMAAGAAECDRLLARLRELEIDVFYVKAPIEFGKTLDP